MVVSIPIYFGRHFQAGAGDFCLCSFDLYHLSLSISLLVVVASTPSSLPTLSKCLARSKKSLSRPTLSRVVSPVSPRRSYGESSCSEQQGRGAVRRRGVVLCAPVRVSRRCHQRVHAFQHSSGAQLPVMVELAGSGSTAMSCRTPTSSRSSCQPQRRS